MGWQLQTLPSFRQGALPDGPQPQGIIRQPQEILQQGQEEGVFSPLFGQNMAQGGP